MTTATHQRMHQDHLDWRSDYDMWGENLRVWQKELVDAKAGVAKLQSELDALERAFACHAAANRLYEEQILHHEHALAEYERGKVDQRPMAANAKHTEEASRRGQQQLLHERIKTHHHDVIRRWRVLLKALEESM